MAQTGNTNAQDAPQGQFGIQKIYVKDLSFETPNSPNIFTDPWKPEVTVNLDSTANNLSQGVYEVILSITATVKLGERTAYLAEVKQAGIFSAQGIPEAQLPHMLSAFCPNILFPYARETVSDLTTRGGFPPLILAPVNFDALYLQRVQQQAAPASPQHTV